MKNDIEAITSNSIPLEVKEKKSIIRLEIFIEQYESYLLLDGSLNSSVLLHIADKMNLDIQSIMINVKSQYKPFKDYIKQVRPNIKIVADTNELIKYENETNKKRISSMIANEDLQILKQACNITKDKIVSRPLLTWTEQNILEYIYKNNIKICSVYGKVIKENNIYKTEKKPKKVLTHSKRCYII